MPCSILKEFTLKTTHVFITNKPQNAGMPNFRFHIAMVDNVSYLDLTFIVQNTYISQPKFIKIIKRFKTRVDNARLDHFSGKDITVSKIRQNLKRETSCPNNLLVYQLSRKNNLRKLRNFRK